MADPTNIPTPVTSKTVQVTAGANLFDIAAAEMNDATRWNDIAELNKLVDPYIQSDLKLKIPSGNRPGNGGIWGV